MKDPGVNGKIILKCILEKWDGDTDWIDLAKVRDKWQAVVNAVMNLRVPQNAGNFLSSFSGRTLFQGVSLLLARTDNFERLLRDAESCAFLGSANTNAKLRKSCLSVYHTHNGQRSTLRKTVQLPNYDIVTPLGISPLRRNKPLSSGSFKVSDVD